MKKTSKIISILMAAVFALSVFAVSASAVATPLTAGNTKETATKIPSYGVEYVSELSKEGEVDWFKFTTLSQDAYYTIALENYNIYENGQFDSQKRLLLWVYDTNSKEIVHLQSTSSTDIKLEKNTTYYIKVAMGNNLKSSIGNYEVFISYKLDPIANVKEDATNININTTYKHSLDGTGDEDWYKFTAPADNIYKFVMDNYNIYENGQFDGEKTLQLHVYDTYSKELVSLHGTSSADIRLEKNTTYYIKIAMGNNLKSSTGNYGFSVNCDSVPTAKTLTKITLTSLPDKLNYKIGESFESTGLAVKAHYSDGSMKEITRCNILNFDTETTGTKSVTVSYTENGVTKTTSFNITVTKADAPSTPDNPDEPGSSSTIDIAAILVAIWQFFVDVFNFIIGLFA